MWHVSSRSCVATLRTAIHLLLTYLLTPVLASLSEPKSDFEIVLNGLGTKNLLHHKFESSFVRYCISLPYLADCFLCMFFWGITC